MGRYGHLARFVLSHRAAVTVFFVATGIVAAAVGLPPSVDPNLVALLPDDVPLTHALKAVGREAGGINTITLVFEGPATMGPELDRLAEDLEALDTVAYAVHGVPPELVPELRARAARTARTPEELARALGTASPMEQVLDPDRILVRPTESNVDPDFCERVVSDVKHTVDAAGLEASGIRLRIAAGPYVYIADGAEGIRSDLVRTSGVATALVLLALVVGFRSLSAPVIVFLPLVWAAVVDFAVLRIVYGSLDSFTSFGTALLIGAGDFPVHLIGRVRQERARGGTEIDAIARAWDASGPACWFGAMTSAAGFGALALAQFKGFAHLGLALGVGLFLSVVAALATVPLLVSAMDRGRVTPPPPHDGSRALGKAAARKALALVFLGLIGLCAFGLPALRFDHDITGMNRARMVFEDMDPVTKAFVRSAYPPVVLTTSGFEETARVHARAEELLASGALPHVRAVVSAASLVSAEEALARVPPGLLALAGGPSRVLLLPQGDLYDLRESSAFGDELARAGFPNAASEQLAQGAVYRMMMHDGPRMLALSLAIIVALVALDLRRRPRLALDVVLTLSIGIVAAAALLGVVGIELTLLNVVGFALLVGIGVDSVLHLAHRLDEEANLATAIRTVGAPALLTLLTTVASFVALVFASSGGIRSLGRLIVVGLPTVVVVSTVLLALLWVAFPHDRAA